MIKVRFLRTDLEVRLLAVFLDELRNIGRQCTVSIVDEEWEVTLF